jgi:putative molybdopterin biosynthesis protein
MGGIAALRQNLCHIASSHLLQDDETEYNFDYATRELDRMPAIVNFCQREQGLLLQKDNPKGINRISDLAAPGLRIVNRPLGTGTRLLFDRELQRANVRGEKIEGYRVEIAKHLDVGLEILAGRVDAAPGIRPVASLLGLAFLPIRWERFDLLVRKERFFDPGVQRFLGVFHEKEFIDAASRLNGYNLSDSGKMVFQQESELERETE